MPDTDILLKILDVLGIMHTAIKNVQLYPPASPTVENTIDKLYSSLQDILKQFSPIIFAESERKLLICGKTLDQKERGKIQYGTTLYTLMNLDIKSISFNKGLEKEELGVFIKYLSKSSDELKEEGGLFKIMEDKNILHIYLNEKIYISRDKDQKTADNITDNAYSNSNTRQTEASKKNQSNSIADMINDVTLLTDKLLNENAGIRAKASEELVGIIESLPPEKQNELVGSISEKLLEWIKLETSATSSYRKMCACLQRLLQSYIIHGGFAQAIPILDVFYKINIGEMVKDDSVRETSLEIMRNLASEDNILILFKELNTNERNKKDEANQILTRFDEAILNKLLDLVLDITDGNERVRIINLIRVMGQRAIPSVKNRINSNAPWYYLRNLAYILGHIGNEANAHVLQPLLLHKNDKVRMEALKSIYQTGGNQRGPLLLSVLPQVDDELRVNIIEMLGKLKCSNAVPNLLDILRNKSLMSKDEHLALQEKVCTALACIGSTEAITPLSEIAESKSFLGIGSYPLKVKYAAQRALDTIKRRHHEKS